MIKTETFAWFDRGGCYHRVVQVWARIPATRIWTIISAEKVDVDPAEIPVWPTGPV